MNDELACAGLMLRASYYADFHRIDDFVALFADDGWVERMGERFVGLAAIRGFMDGRKRERVTRHVLSSPIVEFDSEDAARGVAFFTLFDAIDSEGRTPLPMTLPAAVGEFRQTYRRQDGVWKVASHASAATFRRA